MPDEHRQSLIRGLLAMHNYMMSLGMTELRNDFTIYIYQDSDKLYEAYARETGRSVEEIKKRWDGTGQISSGASAFINARAVLHSRVRFTARLLYDRYLMEWVDWFDRQPTWLRLGSGPFHTYRSLSEAGLLSYESERDGPRGFVERGMNIDRALSAFETSDGFNGVRGDPGNHSLLAVELLASHAGPDALMRYYEPLRLGTTWKMIFRAAFGMTVEEFYDLFDAHRMAGFPNVAIPAPKPPPPTAPRYSIVTRDQEYGYTLDLPDDWVEEEGYIASAPGGEMFILDIDLPAGTTVEQYAESVRDNLRQDWWPSASLFEITSFEKRRAGDQELYSVAYRVQEDPKYCALDVMEVIGVGTSLPGLTRGFRVRHQLCEGEARQWKRQGLDRVRRETLDSFRIITRPSAYYRQFISVEGITVKAIDTVEAVSMYNAADVIKVMMRSLREDIQECMTSAGAGLAIAPQGEYITTLPEFYPQKGKLDRAGGLGAVKGQPISGVVEPPVLRGRHRIVVHEFAHAIENLCFTEDEHDEWDSFYDEARQDNLFPINAYGMTDSDEFFAEFSISYFQQSYEIQRHWISEQLTRQKLSADLPEIFGFLERIYEGFEVEPYVAPTPVATFTPTPTPMPTPTPTPRPASPDRAVLAALYHAADGASWKNNGNWMSDRPIGEWYGVTIDDDGRVTGLALVENGLSGEMPAELGSLAKLESLYLWSNRLVGKIPAELGRLSNLTALSIQDNQLSGEIPSELGNLSNLRGLHLWGNRLSGEIPPELGGLPNLESLWLDGNPLTGCIPQGLRDVSENDLAGLGLPFCESATLTPTSTPIPTRR